MSPHARGLVVRPIGALPDRSPQALVPCCRRLHDELCPRTWAILARLSAIPDAPFSGGPHPLTSRSPASNDSPTAPRHTASSHYIWPTVTPRLDPRAERRHPCAPRPPPHPRYSNWRRLRAQNWRCFFARYHTVSFAFDQPENWGVGEMNSTGRGRFWPRELFGAPSEALFCWLSTYLLRGQFPNGSAIVGSITRAVLKAQQARSDFLGNLA